MTGGSKQNRGPSAGPANRAALIAAAREIFGTRGLDAPLSSIAKKAGVGQGSLYRHFPTRADLATAVFEENMKQIDALAENPEATLRDVVDLVTHHAEGTAALLIALYRTLPEGLAASFEIRLRAAIERTWDNHDGLVGPDTSVDDVMLSIAIVAGVMMQAPPEERHSRAVATWRLLERGLAKPAD